MMQKTTLDEPTLAAVSAKMAAKKRWHGLKPIGEAASPVCYSDEVLPLPDLETFMNRAAMRALSGLSSEQVEHLKEDHPQQYAELLERAESVPCMLPQADGSN